MEKLKALIEQHRRWSELEMYLERIEAHLESDFSLSLENAKALLESISKEICQHHNVQINNTISMNALLKKAFQALGHSGNALLTQVSGALATIGQNMGNLRNNISSTSHGGTMDQLRSRNDTVDFIAREFLIDSTSVVACLLIQIFENNSDTNDSVDSEELDYNACDTFNELWDEIHGEFAMGDYSYTASEVLFQVDYQAYITEYKVFKDEQL